MINAVVLVPHSCSLPASRCVWENVPLWYHHLSVQVALHSQSETRVTSVHHKKCCPALPPQWALHGSRGRVTGAAHDNLREEERQERFLFPSGTLVSCHTDNSKRRSAHGDAAA